MEQIRDVYLAFIKVKYILNFNQPYFVYPVAYLLIPNFDEQSPESIKFNHIKHVDAVKEFVSL